MLNEHLRMHERAARGPRGDGLGSAESGLEGGWRCHLLAGIVKVDGRVRHVV